MRARFSFPAVVVALVALVSAGSAQGAITVANQNDSGPGSLRGAIAAAPAGETIIVPAATYTLTSAELLIEKSLTITGQSSTDTIIRAGGPFRVFRTSGTGNNVTIANVTIRDGDFQAGGGIAKGGGLENLQANLTLRGDLVTNNRADANGGGPGGIAEGGGIASESGALTIEDSTFSGNTATAAGGGSGPGGIVEGGGLAASEVPSSITILRSTFSANTASARGGQASGGGPGGIAESGGVYLEPGPATATNIAANTVSENLVDSSGGPAAPGGIAEGGGMVIESDSPAMSLSNMTVAANTVRAHGKFEGIAHGGGLMLEVGTGDSLTLLSDTLSANTVEGVEATQSGGNIYSEAGVKIANSVISAGRAAPGSENCSSKLESLGFNLESSNQCGLTGPGDQVNKDPLLGALQNNGGSTPTMVPAANSPLVDQGAPFGLTTDQRGVVRPIDFPTIPNAAAPGANGSDIGAVELQPSNAFSLGKLTTNKKKGTAALAVRFPLPSLGEVTLSGKGLKTKSAPVTGAESLKLSVNGKPSVLKALIRHGKRKVKITVTYSPAGNAAATLARTAKLVRKHHHRRR